MFVSTEDFKIVGEEEQENGDLLITFEVYEKVAKMLYEKYGENWQEDFEKDVIDALKKYVSEYKEEN